MRGAACLALALLTTACEDEPSPGADAAPLDVAPDATADVAPDAPPDAAPEAEVSAPDVAPDAPTDAPGDGGGDAARPCVPFTGRAIGTGWNHALAVERSGALRAWGANGSGQLGLGDNTDRARAEAVERGASRWRLVAGGSRHTCGIREDSSLWCWGVNVHGQLGTGDTNDRATPTRVGTDADWVEVTCGGLHSCGVRAGGSLWCWGANPAGQLGLGSETGDRITPQRVGDEVGWRGLAAKARFNCALRPDASLRCWGDNSDGQLGVGDTVDRRTPVAVDAGTRWAQVRMGPLHTCAITTEGALYCWGLNDYGQLGTGQAEGARTPQRVGTDTDWRMVSGGFEHTCGVRTDGSLWCWGNNELGQLGVTGGASTRRVPTRALPEAQRVDDVVTGQGHTCALDGDGAVRCWGDNVSGQAGSGERTATRPTPGAVCGG